MIVINDCSLTAFRWWGGAELNARMLSLSELDTLDNILVGQRYDCENDRIIREEE